MLCENLLCGEEMLLAENMYEIEVHSEIVGLF